MASGTVMPVPVMQFLDGNGDPYSGGKLYTYAAGTTNNLATYTTYDLSGSANANPVILDANGRATVYLQPKGYKFKLDNSSDVEQWVQDNVNGVPIQADTVDITGTAGEALAKPNLVYLSDGRGSRTGGKWYKADADFDYASTGVTLGFATATIAQDATGAIRLVGTLDGFTSRTLGADQFVSGTAGAITETKTTSPRQVGRAMAADTILIAFAPARTDLFLGPVAGGRLTLEDGAPVATSDQTGATTIYYTPYMGNKISLYNTTTTLWTVHEFAQVSHSLSGETADKNWDVFAKSTNGVVSLTVTEWTDDTNRATNLVAQDGVYCKTGALDERYIGTYRTSSTGQCEDSQSKRFVWNAYNQIDRQLYKLPSANTWTYNEDIIRQAGNEATNKVEAVSGLEGSAITVDNSVMYSHSAAATTTFVAVGIGESATDTNATGCVMLASNPQVADSIDFVSAHLKKHKAAGYHYYAMLEVVTEVSGQTTTFYGDNGAPTKRQSGISAIYRN
jgi:hypothetical protein